MTDKMIGKCEETMYESVCKDRFDGIENTIKDGHKETISAVQTLHKKLFVDNGTECLQSRINRHDYWIKAMSWCLGSLALVTLPEIISAIKGWLTR